MYVCVRVYVSCINFQLYCDVYYILLPQMELSLAHIASFLYTWRAYNGISSGMSEWEYNNNNKNCFSIYLFLFFMYEEITMLCNSVINVRKMIKMRVYVCWERVEVFFGVNIRKFKKMEQNWKWNKKK